MPEVTIFSVPIAGHTVQVQIKDELLSKDGERLWGEWDCMSETYTIRLHTDCLKAPEIFYDTLIHELAHAISDIFGLGLKERQVEGLGSGLQQALSSIGRFNMGYIPEEWKRGSDDSNT